jgi:hypothetical protein
MPPPCIISCNVLPALFSWEKSYAADWKPHHNFPVGIRRPEYAAISALANAGETGDSIVGSRSRWRVLR